MKIADLRTTVAAVPYRKPGTSEAAASNHRVAVIVELMADNGLTGLGEAPSPVGVEAVREIIDSTKPLLIGKDPTEPEVIKKLLYTQYNLTHLHIHAGCWALNSVDMALWDLTAKSYGQPLYKLWGGTFRKMCEFHGFIYHGKPDEVADQAAALTADGFRTLYMKIGFDESEDIACVKAARDAVGPDIKIWLDANQSWTPGQAIRNINRLSAYDIAVVDQPVLMYNTEELAHVRAAVDVPIASHESSWTMYDALNVIKRGAADIIYIDPRFDAGFMGARITAGIAEAAGLPVVMHSFGELGVCQHAYLHLIAAVPNFIHANQSGYYQLLDDVIEGGRAEFDGPYLAVPEKPGIGVSLDRGRLSEYARYYEKHVKGKEFTEPRLTPQYMMMQYRRFFGY